MPNRYLKESICTSETLASLKAEEEVFFYRLIVTCDDFGRMDARPAILRPRLYPLALDTISEEDITGFLLALQRAGLIVVFGVEGKPYLEMITWADHQQVRAKHSKFPPPQANDGSCKHLIADDSKCKQPITLVPFTRARVSNTNTDTNTLNEPESVDSPVGETFSLLTDEEVPVYNDQNPEPEFMTLWAMYGRHGNRKPAYQAWKTMKAKPKARQMHPAEYEKLVKRLHTEYESMGWPMPHLSSWLNGELYAGYRDGEDFDAKRRNVMQYLDSRKRGGTSADQPHQPEPPQRETAKQYGARLLRMQAELDAKEAANG